MKNIPLFAMLLLIAYAVSCSKSDDQETSVCGGVSEFLLNEPFYLCYGTEAQLTGDESFVVSFHSLYGDSRCPLDSLALCFWEGRADAGFTATISDVSQSDTLSAAGLSNAAVFDSTLFSNYKIILLAIEPYPTAANSPIPQEDYKLKLIVTQ
jgi:hypothetical protein